MPACGTNLNDKVHRHAVADSLPVSRAPSLISWHKLNLKRKTSLFSTVKRHRSILIQDGSGSAFSNLCITQVKVSWLIAYSTKYAFSSTHVVTIYIMLACTS